MFKYYLLCSQTWLPTVQEVLQADWQEAGHSPQPPVRRVLFNIVLLTVLICLRIVDYLQIKYYCTYFNCFYPFMQGIFIASENL